MTAFVFSSNCGECFTWYFNTEFCLLLGFFWWGMVVLLLTDSKLLHFFAVWISSFRVVCVAVSWFFGVFFFEGEWVGRITNYFNFFFLHCFLT